MFQCYYLSATMRFVKLLKVLSLAFLLLCYGRVQIVLLPFTYRAPAVLCVPQSKCGVCGLWEASNMPVVAVTALHSVREEGGVQFAVNWLLRDANEGGATGCTVDERA